MIAARTPEGEFRNGVWSSSRPATPADALVPYEIRTVSDVSFGFSTATSRSARPLTGSAPPWSTARRPNLYFGDYHLLISTLLQVWTTVHFGMQIMALNSDTVHSQEWLPLVTQQVITFLPTIYYLSVYWSLLSASFVFLAKAPKLNTNFGLQSVCWSGMCGE